MPHQKAVVKTTDMPDDMQQFVVEVAFAAIKTGADNQGIASYVRDAVRHEYPGNWHCIVGTNFGSEVIHGKRGLIFFKLDKHGILLFRTV
ncbi:Dynein light chain LC6, flagellar outer arm [Echinococcus granulosus]|uniref:Dynein light chain n=1 Tax=Echinococcus granulosus TaxID=6210 RepID=U6JIF4_ECHGR|nr:Dynein light chain LC6, flagellar outer arm [Echinococcus granulosus]EUB56597.1 Dynein light chain LC6, flagellar outer arm [Echinococcus granulosus]CDS21553.1 dynein light chain [Echinococcus granulosus]